MAPAPAAAAALFHPRKKSRVEQRPGTIQSRSASPTKRPGPSSKPSPAPEPPAPSSLPDGPYTEFKLVSSAINGWKYDVMKFDSHKPVDILKWAGPVKLNRKDIRRAEAAGPGEGEPAKAVAPMMGPDGKPVIGMDGRIVMVDAEGKPIHGDAATSGNAKGKAGGGKKKFQKKTKQIFKVADETRQLRKEERYPWVMEDATGDEVWTGHLEDSSRAITHAFFMPASNNTFKFVPSHRWYKFQKKPNYRIPNLEEAESLMALREKNKDAARWLLHNRGGVAPSASTSAIFKAEASEGLTQSLGPGGRRLRTVAGDSSNLFGDDDDGVQRPRRDLGADADYDEVPYQEDFADDEEQVDMIPELDEELHKDMEERLQKEYMSANKQTDGTVDADEDEEDLNDMLTGAGKAMKKLMKKFETNVDDDSDDEGNPYASEEESEEEEQPVVADGPAVQPQMTVAPPSRANSQAPPAQGPPQPSSRPVTASTPASRATSPVPNHGGHSIVAKRATSPKVPKPKGMGAAGRAGSPLAQGAAGSPQPSSGVGRATSPSISAARAAISNGTSLPGASLKRSGTKRKAVDDAEAGTSAQSPTTPSAGPPKPKKRKGPPPALDAQGNPIYFTNVMVLEWLQNTPTANTRDCIMHFTPYLHNDAEKSKFTALIKEVAQLKNGVLVLRSSYRTGDGEAGSPTPDAT